MMRKRQRELLANTMPLYGAFLNVWNNYELVLEVAIMRLLKIKATDAHILLGGLMFKGKSSILKALLHDRGDKNKKAIQSINALTKYAERNLLVHGYVWFTSQKIGFVKRDLDDKLKVKEKTFNLPAMGLHVLMVETMLERLKAELGVTDSALRRYRNRAESLIKRS